MQEKDRGNLQTQAGRLTRGEVHVDGKVVVILIIVSANKYVQKIRRNRVVFGIEMSGLKYLAAYSYGFRKTHAAWYVSYMHACTYAYLIVPDADLLHNS